MTAQPDNLVGAFRQTATRYPDRIAQRVKREGTWQETSFADCAERIRRAAAACVERGLNPGDRVALLATNCPEWTQADLALLSAGAIVVPIFPSSTPDQIRYIVENAGARALIIGGPAEAAKLAALPEPLQGVEFVASLHPVELDGVGLWSALESTSPESLQEVDRRVAQMGRDDVATLIYTSGTTGEPKGVVLTHGAFLSEFEALDQIFTVRPEDHSLSFLPLSHALERAWTFFVLLHGCANSYVENPKQVADFLREVRPTLFVCVPALYEKVYATAQEQVASSAVKKAIMRWALGVGGRLQRQYRKGKRPPLWWRLQLPLADRLVLRSVRDGIGGPKTVLAAGGAPLRQDLEEFFSACGLLVCQGYGLTEAAPLISFNSPADFKFGTAGRVMAGGEIRIGEDGEILYKGPNVMQGYWKNEEATRDSFTDDGFLRTGDVGYVDKQGFLVITDRLKDLLVTSNGKNIAPQPIESLILSDPLFVQAVVLGNNRPVVTMLATPSMPHLEKLAEQLQIRWESRDELLNQPQILDAIRERIEQATQKLPHHEQIKDFRLLLEEFNQENGLLTPTLKVRRREVEQRFADRIDEMYTKLGEMRKAARH